MAQIRDNIARRRFELEESGAVAFADYRRQDGLLIIDHVEAPPPLRGAGTAGRLMAGIAQLARSEDLRIMPLCGYAAHWLRRHAESDAFASRTTPDQAAGR
jgi:predicted GNAT family acetyltransferase